MSWEQIRGHDAPLQQLRAAVQQGRLGHTFLFSGPAGIGKRMFAVQLAECLLCQRHAEADLEACGTCSGCKQVLARSHPDFFIVGCPPGKRELPIEVFLGPPERRGQAGLCYDLSHTPIGGGRKIAIIDDAELMNEASANALLKTLEEPPPHSLIILLTTDTDHVLPTIRSRCQILRFDPLPESDVAELLLQNEATDDPASAASVAALSGGSLATAQALLEPEVRQQREALYQQLSASRLNGLLVAQGMLQQVEAAGSEASAQRERAGWLIRFATEFYRTALWACIAAGEPVRQSALVPQAIPYANRWAGNTDEVLAALAGVIDRLIQASEELEHNAVVGLCLETLWDDLGRRFRTTPLAV